MSDSEPVASGIESTTSMIEELGKVFTELKSHEDAPESKVQWKDIEDYFNNLEKLLKQKFDEFNEKEKSFVEKHSQTRAIIAERESDVIAKERASLDRIQELKEAAVADILEAREKYKPPSPEPVVDGNAESKVNSSLNGDLDATNPAPEDSSPNRLSEKPMAVEVKPCPELLQNLAQFCEQMDAKGLLKFIMENQNHFAAIIREMPIALKVATEPARLVLNSLEGFYPPEQLNKEDNDQTTNEVNVMVAALPGMRRSCIMLMESVTPLLVGTEPGADDPLNPETKQQAKAMADGWKSRLVETEVDACNVNSLEVEAFLQLLATFRIASEFDEEELCRLVLAVAHSSKAPELCRSLGLTDKMPGIIESLNDRGRQIDAVHLVQAFGLTESFSPVPMLKTYLKELRRNLQGKGPNSGSAGAESDANSQELAAVKAVIKCVREYKFEADYPLEPLERCEAQLERSKGDKKRLGGVKHQQPKKARGTGGYYGSRVPFGAGDRQPPPPIYGRAGAYMGAPERYPQVDYHGPSQGLYGQQPAVQRSYYYPQDERVPAAPYGGAPSNYGQYTGSGFQSSHQSYI